MNFEVNEIFYVQEKQTTGHCG